MIKLAAKDTPWEKVKCLGVEGLFCEYRIDKESIPKGYHMYQVRHDDEGFGDPCELALYILVNFLGTFLTKEELPLEPFPIINNGSLAIDPEKDWEFTGEVKTYNLNGFIAWEDFKALPNDLKIEYLNGIIDKYGVGIDTISQAMFGKARCSLRLYLDRRDILEKINRPSNSRNITVIKAFRNAVREAIGGEVTKETETSPDIVNDIQPEEAIETVDIPEPEKCQHFTGVEVEPSIGRVEHAKFIINGFDNDTFELIAMMFEGRKVRIHLSVSEVEE